VATRVELVIVDCPRGRVLVRNHDDALPWLGFPGPHAPMDHVLTDTVRTAWGLETAILRPLWYDLLALECRSGAAPAGLHWAEPGKVTPGRQRAVVRSVLDGRRNPPAGRPDWYRPGWVDRVTGWVDAQLAARGVRRKGALVQVKHWSQSAVLRFPTDTGALYVKAVIPELAGEPALLAVVAERFGGYVPQVVATDDCQQRWITRDFGGISGWDLAGERTACLSVFAELQAGLAGAVDVLAAAGCPSRAAADLAAAVGPLLARDDLWHDRSLPRSLTEQEWEQFHRLAPRLEDYCGALEGGVLPPTLIHGDLEPLNVVRTGASWLVHDWTFAAIGHPFYDLACWLSDCDDAEAEAAVAAYLDAWRPYASDAELRREWAAAKPVGGLAELLKFVQLCDAVERDQWFSWTPMLFGWARRLLRFLKSNGPDRAGW
jgi:hypothetical protein